MGVRFVPGSVALGVALLAGWPGAASASRVKACPGVGPTSTLVRDGSWLESSAFDVAGRLVYDDWLGGRARVLDAPSARPRSLGHLQLPGGIARAADGSVVVAQGNEAAQLIGGASILRLDPVTGAKTRVASGLVGANGLTRAADGTIYTSDVGSGLIDRVAPDGTVTHPWWHGSGGPNGLAISADGRTLYAAMARSARIMAFNTASRAARVIYRSPDVAPVFDGLTLDRQGLLYVALYFGGEIHRIDPATGKACRLTRGLTLPTSIAFAPPAGAFDPDSAYVTSFGAIKRIEGAVPVPASAG